VKRTAMMEYNSCDLCDDRDVTILKCDVCGKYLCKSHNCPFPWSDQLYNFCPKHHSLVTDIVNSTGIPIGFVVGKLRPEPLSQSVEKMFQDRGYAANWNDEWKGKRFQYQEEDIEQK